MNLLGQRLSHFVALAAGWALLAAPVAAQDVAFNQTPPGSLITQDESGGRNIPNFRFDATHTAGGHFQITDTNWRHYAPPLGIDLETYPNAMSASEQLQGQVAGKMWAEQGYMPWTCCNKQLRDHLTQQPQPQPVKVRRAAESPERSANASAHVWDVFLDEPDEQQLPTVEVTAWAIPPEPGQDIATNSRAAVAEEP